MDYSNACCTFVLFIKVTYLKFKIGLKNNVRNHV